MLKLLNIKKDYKVADSTVHALKGIDLEFRKNEFVCILGQSGCGKTTLLNIIGGLDHYTSGDLIINDKSTKDFKDRDWDIYRNHQIGFIFQSYNLIPHQTVLGNVELALTISGIGREERKERARQALERVGLGAELNKRPNQLSGGQMQRVAIARALVNNPAILLADEPTGALDSKTSVQIMELIKEIAGERLVIMVTHNPELAEDYASRIVRLKDGLVEADSNPYDGTADREMRIAEAKREVDALEGDPEKIKVHKKQLKAKRKRENHARMSYLTSLALSARNLLTKKGRTIVTSIAGSIGIISVCLVLALSSGFNNYIKRTEEDMLSYYPVQVTESTFDVASIMTSFSSPADMPDLKELGDKVYVDSFLTGLAGGMTVRNNITESYLDYLEKMDEGLYAAIQYGYGVSLTDNLFTQVTTGATSEEAVEQYMSLSRLKEFYISELQEHKPEYSNLIPFADFFGNIVNKMPGSGKLEDESYGKYVLSQYDVIEGSFPKNANEAVLVIGGNNDVTDLTLAQLGLLEEPKFLSLFEMGSSNKKDGEYLTVGFDEIVGKQYVLYNNGAVYSENPNYNPMDSSSYPYRYNGMRDGLSVSEGQGIAVTVTGILRLKEGLTYGCLQDGLNLTEATVEQYIQGNLDSDLVKTMKENSRIVETEQGDYILYHTPPAENLAQYYNSVTTTKVTVPNPMVPGTTMEVEMEIKYTMEDTAIRHVGGDDSVNAISIYGKDFDSKDELLAYLDQWNEWCEQYGADQAAFEKEYADLRVTDPAAYAAAREKAERNWGYKYTYMVDGEEITVTLKEGNKITYTDRVGLLMGMVQTMLNVITYVLVAFTAISLVVSSVMIGIITYVSVVERVKEIGVLRSLGARKQDIKNLFNAETFIIGLTAGLIGIAVTYLLELPINAIIYALTGIAGIAALPVLTAFVMVVISVLLTLISGLIPASAAAKKDPVIALRTE